MKQSCETRIDADFAPTLALLDRLRGARALTSSF